MSIETPFSNPFRPGAGHRPPYLAGRKQEEIEFRRLLTQSTILENMVLTGLRGVGKTVLMETFKPLAQQQNWLWVGTDLSESASISEAHLAERLITDLSVVTKSIAVGSHRTTPMGFTAAEQNAEVTLDYERLSTNYKQTPGLVADKIKAVCKFVAPFIRASGKRGVIFAYDEAQNLSDHAAKDQFPMSVMLDVFQSIQRQDIPFMLLLVGLPTLFPKLVESRTYAERMFRVVFLKQLSGEESKEAIKKPVEEAQCPVKFSDSAVNLIAQSSRGYPYFIQFMCREAFDNYLQRTGPGDQPAISMTEIERKLDTDFFAGRWARVTDRQQELLEVVACLESATEQFTVQEILAKSRDVSRKPFGRSHINQILSALIHSGLIYKDRHGKYLFAVPLMAEYIKRLNKPERNAFSATDLSSKGEL
jgi:AAA ATPase domain